MAELKMQLVSLFGILVLALPALCDHELKVLEVACENNLLSPNVYYAFQDICGQGGYVITRLSDQDDNTFPWSMYAGINDTTTGELSIMYAEITKNDAYIEDVTYLLKDQVVKITDTTFDGRTVIIGVTLTSFMGDIVYTKTDERRLVPNFNETDIELWINPYVPTIYLTDTHTTLKSAMGAPEFDNLVSGWVNGSLPEPTEVSAGYFVAAYVEPTSHWNRKKRQAYDNNNFFDQRTLIGRPLLYRNAYDLPMKIEELYNFVRNNEIVQLYGSGNLVIDADVFNITWNQRNKTNDVVRIPYYSSRTAPQMEGPECSIIRNAWTTGDAGFFRDSVHNDSMYGASLYREFYMHDGEGKWHMQVEEAEKKGYFYLNMLQAYLEDPSEFYFSQCNNSDVDILLIQFVEGTEETETFMNLYSDHNLTLALTQVGELMFGYQIPENVIANMEGLMNNPSSFYDLNFNKTVSDAIAMASFNETKKLAMAKLLSYDDLAPYLNNISTYRHAACGLTESFKQGREHLHNTSSGNVLLDSAEIKAHLKNLVQHATSLIVLSSAAGQPYDGLLDLLNGAQQYAQDLDRAMAGEDVGTLTFEALFNKDDLKHEIRRKGTSSKPNECAQWPNYALKFASLCRVPDTATRTDIFTSKEDVCKTFAFRKLAKSIWRNLGLKELTEYWERKDDQGCSRDSLNPKDGLSTIWKVEDTEDGTPAAFQGVLSLDKSSVYWTKKAVCSCQVCNDGGSGGTTGGWNGPTGSTHGWNWPTGSPPGWNGQTGYPTGWTGPTGSPTGSTPFTYP